mgnify:CR=1 FL=1
MNNLLFIVTISTCVNGDGFIHHRGAVMSINIQEVGKNTNKLGSQEPER